MDITDVEDFPRDIKPQRLTVRSGGSDFTMTNGNFVFDRVFKDDVNQEMIYKSVADDLVTDMM